MCEGRFFEDFVDFGGEDQPKVLGSVSEQSARIHIREAGDQRPTSGVPLGSRNASGTKDRALDRVVPDGGEGLDEYSVNESPVSFTVWSVGV